MSYEIDAMGRWLDERAKWWRQAELEFDASSERSPAMRAGARAEAFEEAKARLRHIAEGDA